MNEKTFLEGQEAYNMKIVEVNGESIHRLRELRVAIDGAKNTTPLDKFEKELSRYAQGGDNRAFLICEGDTAIGYIEVDLKEDYIPHGADPEKCKELDGYAHIARVGLLEEYHGRRIGDTLLKYADELVQKSNVPGVWLDYLPEKEGLVRFYERNGYTTFLDFDSSTEKRRRIAIKKFTRSEI